MPPRKKRKSAGAPKEPEEPLDFVTHIREKAQKRFASRRKNVNYDIEQNVREIRALLNINAEIFGRVIDSASNYSSGESVTLTRYGFDAVKVRQSGESTEFITEPVCSEDTFPINALLHLPDNLNGVLVVQYQAAPFNNFIDYNAFFRSALMLHDDILEPFLVKLKDHVESIHVLLGEMESWLVESQRKIEFIETTFDTKLETPSPDQEVSDCNCPSGHGFTRCLRCSEKFYHHTRDTISGHRLCCQFNYPGHKFRCKKRVPKIHILKKYDHDGKFEKTFQITTESEQAKLKKCLEYMDS
mmetsp:Transcript_18029/g.36182  ORF Transcript_18029/g.36182 Transcript_18029/m.36182 type:complete len:300 (+) Transcript_18029:89-988(+)